MSRSRRNPGHQRSSNAPDKNIEPPTTMNATSANLSPSTSSSHLDRRDPPDDEEADHFQSEPHEQHRGPGRMLDRVVEVPGIHEPQEDGQAKRTRAHEDRAPSLLGGDRVSMAQQFEPLANDLAQPIEGLGQVPARRPLDSDGRAEEHHITGWDPLGQLRERIARV